MRLTQTWQKALYVVGLFVVGAGAGRVLSALGFAPGTLVNAVVIVVIWSVGIYGATRIFRGAGEPVGPSRALWRMTARPLAGYLLGALMIFSNLLVPLQFVFDPRAMMISSVVANLLYAVVFGALYLHSSIRLSWADRASADSMKGDHETDPVC